MANKISQLALQMIQYEEGCNERINHFLKVQAFARMIALSEAIDEQTLFILEAAALVHDVGIRASLEKFGYYNAGLQQAEGPPVCESMLKNLTFDSNVIERVSYLVAHHHTYNDIQGMDYQILVEADFLVNIFENQMPQQQIAAVKQNIFKTRTGTQILRAMYE